MICGQCGTLNENERTDCVRCHKSLHSEAMRGKIACAVHGNREATTSCGSCGMRLCQECAVSANGVDFCESCAPATAERHHYDEDYERIPVVDPGRAVRAGFGRRMLGIVLELAAIGVFLIILGLILFVVTGQMPFVFSPTSGPGFWIFYGLLLLGSITYASIMTSMSGQTWGKQVAGVIVLQPDGRVLNLKKATLRSFAALFSAIPLGLGFLMVLWDPQQEAWHDKIAGTAVYLWEEIT